MSDIDRIDALAKIERLEEQRIDLRLQMAKADRVTS